MGDCILLRGITTLQGDCHIFFLLLGMEEWTLLVARGNPLKHKSLHFPFVSFPTYKQQFFWLSYRRRVSAFSKPIPAKVSMETMLHSLRLPVRSLSVHIVLLSN